MGCFPMLPHISKKLEEFWSEEKYKSFAEKEKMASNIFSWLAAAVMFEIAVCCFAVGILHLQDEQQDDSSFIEKRSFKYFFCVPI